MASVFHSMPALLIVSLIFILSLLICPNLASKCDTCRSIATKFKEGLEKTSKSNFGGGNTNWEERKLGTYAHSETRLLEILDQCCDEKECHYMLEENEDALEEWWFKDYAKNKQDNLLEAFCINNIKVCCPDNTYGKDCKPCTGGLERPCNGNGKCEGGGTREGSGKCQCDAGYEGELCDQCSVGYYIQSSDNNKTVCAACHRSCNSTCTGPTSKDCESCGDGWMMSEIDGCVDVDECSNDADEKKLCADHQYCENTEGSYLCQNCDLACEGCTGAGSSSCVKCTDKYFLGDDNTCTACHTSCGTSCTDSTPLSCDRCADGWIFIADHGCQDIDECSKGRFDCSKDTYCLNTQGSYVCKACHETCKGCVGPGPDDCMMCNTGYERSDDMKECVDIDECLKNLATCNTTSERCQNTVGSYKCTCLSDYVNVRGKCQLKNKGKKKKKTKDDNESNSISETSGDESAKNFEGKLEESIEGFQEALKDIGAPAPGLPLDETVVMEGKFDIPSASKDDSSASEAVTKKKEDGSKQEENISSERDTANRYPRDDL